MRWCALLILPLTLLSACTHNGGDAIQRGTPITHVQFDIGLPDVISDQFGDLARFYTPTSRPAEEWPAEAPRTFYYLPRNLAVTFVRGAVVRTEAIDPETREYILSQVLRRQGASSM